MPEDNSIHYGHRTTGGIDIYFLSNQTDQETVIQPEFRVVGKQPELWDATNGETRLLPAFEFGAGFTSVPLKLAPYESVFVVFRKKADENSINDITANYPTPKIIEELKGPWTVKFDPSFIGPTNPVIFESLQDWTVSENDSIKYYSGTATYSITFNLSEESENSDIVIDFGSLTAMGKVKVNGNYVGGVWTHPYKLNVTKWVKLGQNDLEIEVVNNWMNRLIGDHNLPENQRRTVLR